MLVLFVQCNLISLVTGLYLHGCHRGRGPKYAKAPNQSSLFDHSLPDTHFPMQDGDFHLAMLHFFNETTAQAVTEQYPANDYKLDIQHAAQASATVPSIGLVLGVMIPVLLMFYGISFSFVPASTYW
jgi:hypothetical protein